MTFSHVAYKLSDLQYRLDTAEAYYSSLVPGVHDYEQIEAAYADVRLAHKELEEYVEPEMET